MRPLVLPDFPRGRRVSHALPVTDSVASTEALSFVDLCRAAVLVVAPEELPHLADVADAWFRGEGDRRDAPVGTIGFGFDVPVLAELILPIVTGAVAQVVGSAAERGLLRRRRAPERTLPAEALDRAEAVRDECRQRALDARFSRRQADQIADAVYAELIRAARDDRR